MDMIGKVQFASRHDAPWQESGVHALFLGMQVFFRNYLEDRLSPHVSPLFTDQKLRYLIEAMGFDMEPGVFFYSQAALQNWWMRSIRVCVDLSDVSE